MKEKFKSLLADDSFYTASLVLGVGVLAFLLGRLSAFPLEQQNIPTVNPLSLCPTTLCPAVDLGSPAVATTSSAAGQVLSTTTAVFESAPYVASKAGTKYHHITCPGAKQIKEENKIYFATVTQAQAAGYSKAANCNR
jgi:hypothetical protein